MGKITVRLIENEAEREAIYAFRYQVYVEELGMTKVADHYKKWLHDEYDEQSITFAVFEDDRIVGSLRCIILDEVGDASPLIEKFEMSNALERFGPKRIVTTSRFMITPRLRNTRAVYYLMREAFVEAQRRGIRLNFGDCSPHLLPFYEQLGYRRYRDGFTDTVFGYKLPIVMLVRDQMYMQRVRSPLAGIIPEEDDDVEARAWFAETYPDFVNPLSAPFMPEEVFFDVLAERVGGDPVHAIAMLRGLGQAEAERLLTRATVIKARPGHVVVRQGERDNTLYILLSGFAEIRLGGELERLIAMKGPGDTFGEIGFLTSVPRTATVVAKTDAEVLVLSGDFMERFIRTDPAIGAQVLLNLAKELAGRLAETTKHLAVGG